MLFTLIFMMALPMHPCGVIKVIGSNDSYEFTYMTLSAYPPHERVHPLLHFCGNIHQIKHASLHAECGLIVASYLHCSHI